MDGNKVNGTTGQIDSSSALHMHTNCLEFPPILLNFLYDLYRYLLKSLTKNKNDIDSGRVRTCALESI